MRILAFLFLLVLPGVCRAAEPRDARLRLVFRPPPPDAAPLSLRSDGILTDITGSRIRLLPVHGLAISFSLPERLLRTDIPADSVDTTLSPPHRTGADCVLSGTTEATGPKLVARSKTDAGRECWQAPLPAPATVVSYSGDDRLVLAALRDGTVRWFDAATGHELLALALDPTQRRWVAWTPSGYYDTARDGAERLGWELPREPGQPADFFRMGLFHDRLLRPDLINRLLFVKEERTALEQVNAESGRRKDPEVPLVRQLPPVVQVDDPQPGAVVRSPRITVRFTVRSPSGEPIATPRIFFRGQEMQTRGLPSLQAGAGLGGPPQEQHFQQEVDVPAEDTTLVVMAETALSPAEPKLVPLRWGGPVASGPPVRPDLFVLAVGVSAYKDRKLRLGFPAKDARDLASTLLWQQGRRYRRVQARVLTDADAGRSAIVAGLRWLREHASPSDVVAVFLAGHGVTDTQGGAYAYYPYDVEPGNRGTELGEAVLREELGRTQGRVVLFIDTCHAGKVDLSRMTDNLSNNESGVVVYNASTAGQASLERAQWNNGAFTKALVEGLRGKADRDNTGRITTSELEHYVSERVRELTEERQVPTSAKPGSVPDFWLAAVTPRYRLERKWWFWGVTALAVGGIVTGALFATTPWAQPVQVLPFTGGR